MAERLQKVKLKDLLNRKDISPYIQTSGVYNKDGDNLDTILNNINIGGSGGGTSDSPIDLEVIKNYFK